MMRANALEMVAEVVLQAQNEGRMDLLSYAFYSKLLLLAEYNYMKAAFQQWRHFLEGQDT